MRSSLLDCAPTSKAWVRSLKAVYIKKHALMAQGDYLIALLTLLHYPELQGQ